MALPAISHSLEREYLTEFESQVLKMVADKQEIMASDLKALLPGKSPSEITRVIRNLIDKKKLLSPVAKNARKYVISFQRNYLLRGIIWALAEKGFLPNNEIEEL